MARLILIYREEQRLVELLNNQPTEPIVVNVVEVGKGSQVCENCEKAVLDKRFYLRVGSQVFRWCSRCYRRTKHDAGFCLTHVPNQNDHGKPPPIILLNLAYLCGGQNLHRLNPPPPSLGVSGADSKTDACQQVQLKMGRSMEERPPSPPRPLHRLNIHLQVVYGWAMAQCAFCNDYILDNLYHVSFYDINGNLAWKAGLCYICARKEGRNCRVDNIPVYTDDLVVWCFFFFNFLFASNLHPL